MEVAPVWYLRQNQFSKLSRGLLGGKNLFFDPKDPHASAADRKTKGFLIGHLPLPLEEGNYGRLTELLEIAWRIADSITEEELLGSAAANLEK